MGCNCGKPQRPRPRPQQGDGSGQQAQSGGTQSFALLTPKGSEVGRYGSRLEAEAQNVRTGRTGIIRPIQE